MKQKVDFLIAGTQKAGTTALDSYLRLHPEICMAKQKEVHFFDNDEYFINPLVDYSYYHSVFPVKVHHKVIGETTPIYMYWKYTPERIFQYNPNMKFIIILRNPLERSFSHWNMEVNRKNETLSFWNSINRETRRLNNLTTFPQHPVQSYVSRGFYSQQLTRIWNLFPKSNVLIIRYEDYALYPKETLDKICSFLSISTMPQFEVKSVFKTKYRTKITLKEQLLLIKIYEEEIDLLENLLGWDCSNWLKIKDTEQSQ